MILFAYITADYVNFDTNLAIYVVISATIMDLFLFSAIIGAG